MHAAQTHVLVVGGAYGGVSFIVKLLEQLDIAEAGRPAPDVHITLVDQRDGFYHSVGTPLSHVSKAHTEPFWRTFDSLKVLSRANVTVRQGLVVKLDLELNTAVYVSNGAEFTLHFDHAVVATGLQRSWPCAPSALDKRDYVSQALHLIERMASQKRVVVVGAGAVGVEVAAEIKDNYPATEVYLVHSRSEILSNEPLPQEFKQKARRMLEDQGVHVVLNQRASVKPLDGTHDTVVLDDGRTIDSAVVFAAASRWTPCTAMLPRWALDATGYVRVSPFLQIIDKQGQALQHYAIGDAAAWTGIRRAGGALAMGRCAAINLAKSLRQAKTPAAQDALLEAFPDTPPMIALALGSTAVSYSPAAGVKEGQEVMDMMFGVDLGWTIVQRYLGIEKVVAAVSVA